MFHLIRIIHGLITAFFLTCIGYIHYSGITNRVTPLTLVAIGAVTLESVVVIINRGDCPMGPLHRKFGDDKAFFELFLPKRAAKLAGPVLGVIFVIGVVLVIF